MGSKRVVASRSAARVGVIGSSLALLAILISPNTALAATTIGAPAGDPVTAFCSLTADAVQVSTDSTTTYIVPSGGGSITSWSSQTALGMNGLVGLQVWRLVTPANSTTRTPAVYMLVGASPLVTPTGTATTLAAPIAVLQGDVLGMRMQGNVACGNHTGAALDFWATAATASPPVTGASESFPFISSGSRLNISATVTSTPPPPPPPPPPPTGCSSPDTSSSSDSSNENDECDEADAADAADEGHDASSSRTDEPRDSH